MSLSLISEYLEKLPPKNIKQSLSSLDSNTVLTISNKEEQAQKSSGILSPDNKIRKKRRFDSGEETGLSLDKSLIKRDLETSFAQDTVNKKENSMSDSMDIIISPKCDGDVYASDKTGFEVKKNHPVQSLFHPDYPGEKKFEF